MTVQTLYTAATGMSALETKLDVIANNLANIETVGFKRGRANFEDLFYRHEMMPGAVDTAGQYTATGTSVGTGTRVSSVQSNFVQGSPKPTGQKLDVAVEGSGFFQVTDPSSGDTLYTRAGNFSLNSEGQLVLSNAYSGKLLLPAITIPSDTTALQIDPDGTVRVSQSGSPTMTQVGQIELANFPNPEGLIPIGENLFLESDASGNALTGQPGTDSLGETRQNTLEGSNVSPVEELVDLISTQRAFEMNSQVVQAADESLKVIANLRR